MKVASSISFRFTDLVILDLQFLTYLIVFPVELRSFAFPDAFIFKKRNDLDPFYNIDKVARVGKYAIIAYQSVNTEFPFRHGIAAWKMLRGRVSRNVESRRKKSVSSRREQAKKKNARRRRVIPRYRELSYANSNRMQPVSFTIP